MSLNNTLLIFVALLFFIPITFFSAYSEQCSDDKLCFKEGDYFVTESNMYGEEPSIRVIYKYFGLGDNDRIIIIKDIISLDPGMKSGETLPNGTIQWSNQSQDEIEIPRKYPYNNGYGQWIMFLPHMTIENLQKLFKNDKITEEKYDFKKLSRSVLLRSGGDSKYIIDKETGLILYSKYYMFGHLWESILVDTNMISSSQESNSEKIIEQNKTIIEDKLPINLKKYNKIPEWVKNTMKWYLDGSISEDEMISAIQFLVKEGIIKLN